MTDLYLCIGALSQTPYFLAGLGVNIYSMDELCYYLVKDAYILDNDLIDQNFCDYLRDSLKMTELSEKLRGMVRSKVPLGEMVTTVLEDTGYCTPDEIRRVKGILVDNASLSFAAKRKLRGDNLQKAGKYTRAIEEYQYVLSSLKSEEEPELYSAILHNIGCSYAQLFLFDKAGTFFKRAYELDGNTESLVQYLVALRLGMSQEEYDHQVLRCGYDERIVLEAQRRFVDGKNAHYETKYYEQFNHIVKVKDEGHISAYYTEVDNLLREWKQDYRRSLDAGTV